MSLAEKNPNENETQESTQASSSSSSDEFDPNSPEAFNAVMMLDPELLRPFCFYPTWAEHTKGYAQEVTDNMDAESRALKLIDLPQSKLSPSEIKELTEEEPDLIWFVPRMEAARKRMIITEALARVEREKDNGGLEMHKALELGLLRRNHSYSSSGSEENFDEAAIITTSSGPNISIEHNLVGDVGKSDSKENAGGSGIQVSEGSNLRGNKNVQRTTVRAPLQKTLSEPSFGPGGHFPTPTSNAKALEFPLETFSQRGREPDIGKVTNQNQPVRSPRMSMGSNSPSHNQEAGLKSSEVSSGDDKLTGKKKFKFWRSLGP